MLVLIIFKYWKIVSFLIKNLFEFVFPKFYCSRYIRPNLVVTVDILCESNFFQHLNHITLNVCFVIKKTKNKNNSFSAQRFIVRANADCPEIIDNYLVGFKPGTIQSIITMTSWWAWWRLKSPASPLFTQPFIQKQIKENIKAPRHWPLCGEFTEDQWINTLICSEKFCHAYGRISYSKIVNKVTWLSIIAAFSSHDWQPSWIFYPWWRVSYLYIIHQDLSCSKTYFCGKYCVSMPNRSWVRENPNFDFSSFSMADILKMATGRPGIPKF